MLPPKLSLPADQRRLLRLFSQLDQQGQASLMAFAEFLVSRDDAGSVAATAPQVPAEPAPIPRPPQESVVAAMRRLSRTYHMLEKGDVLHHASALMGAHVLQGRPAVEVIDELEALFRREYEQSLKAAGESGEPG